MPKYSRKILTIGAIVAAICPALSTVACGMKFGNNFRLEGGQIYMITDGGASSVKDKSFNQYAFDGIESYANDSNKTYSFIQVQNSETETFEKAYESAINNNAKVLILPGFRHSTKGKYYEKALEHKHVAFIGVDTFGSNPNVLNLKYKSEQSGFLAAVYSGIFLNSDPKYKRKGAKSFKVAGFAGNQYRAVTPYNDGWLQGVRFFNDNIAKNMLPLEHIFVSHNKRPTSSDFTGDFNAGSATSIVDKLITKGAQVIMSVAAPQTGDTIGGIKKARKEDVFAIGVDTDQSKIFDAKYMIGSALKGIDTSTAFALQELYQNKLTKENHHVNSSEVQFKNNNLVFDYQTKYQGKPIVDFIISKHYQNNKHQNYKKQDIYLKAIKQIDQVKNGWYDPKLKDETEKLNKNDLPKNITHSYGDLSQ